MYSQFLISETFVSRQGEGQLTGTESFFVRTSGCNLRCWFCDTPYASWHPEGTTKSLEDLVAAAVASGVRHVVLTGGEPLIAKGISELCRAMQKNGMHVTIETAGTVDIPTPCDLLSLSPKLRGSGPDSTRHPRWSRTHEARRMPIPIMRRLIDAAIDHQVKFVIDRQADTDEVLSVVESLGVVAGQVWIMPQGVSVNELDASQKWLRPWAESHGYRYCDRMQIRWYGNKRGT